MRGSILLRGLFAGLACAALPLYAADSQLGAAQLDAIAALAGSRLWFHESEFGLDHQLRATPEHVVILHLEPGARGKRIRNTIPYVFTRTRSYTFCARDGDPHIQSLELVREGSHAIVVHVPRGGPCVNRSIEAGLYQLVVEHDGSGVGPAGKKAFVHLPRIAGPAANGRGKSQGELGATAAAPTFNCNARYVFSAANGRFPTAPQGGTVTTEPAPADTWFASSWSICADANNDVSLIATRVDPSFQQLAMVPVLIDDTYNFMIVLEFTDPSPAHYFKLIDLGNGRFSLMLKCSSGYALSCSSTTPSLYPVVLDPSGYLKFSLDPTTPPAVFNVEATVYPGQLAAPSVAYGEVMLADVCSNAQDYWVFKRDVPDFSRYTAFGEPLSASIASVTLNAQIPRSPAFLYTQPNFAGTQAEMLAEHTCLSGTALGNGETRSMKIATAREFVAATNDCQNCDLSGVDLSNLDLSGGLFQGSTFTGANLTNTNFQSANLARANVTGAGTVLNGTSFLGALLQCANFSGAKLGTATFQIPGVIKPVVTKDYSCRLDLTGATINVGSFPLDEWRYFNLTAAIVNGVDGATLSTVSAPLELSGAVLSKAQLGGAKLDGANFGCATTTSGAQVCTAMSDVVLTKASLKKAKLVNGQLQGAHLDKANLDGANLCAARLNRSPDTGGSATLLGAQLRNVNLSQSDLTGANFDHANFYTSGSTGGSCTSTACGATTNCASAAGAVASGTSFAGAYLAGTDFNGSSPQSANFSSAYLLGANFTGANLSEAPSGSRTNFTEAWLQGVRFNGATNVKDALFTNAYVDFSYAASLYMKLPDENLAFAGNTSSGCVLFTYPKATTMPTTNETNVCPDGSIGACAGTQWTSRGLAPQPPVCTPVDYTW